MSLRPQYQHQSLRRAAAAAGAGTIALAPWRLQMCNDATTRTTLSAALQAARVIFTSPAAVRAAAALEPLVRMHPGQQWCAIGHGTALALQRAGITHVQAPRRMDSEGLLDLPALQKIAGLDVGLVTAPDGREHIAPALHQRGAHVVRADVYRREPATLPARAINALLRAPDCLWLALSSGGALQHVLAQLPAPARTRLLQAQVTAASPRLACLAQAHGFRTTVVASSARPADLITAAVRAHTATCTELIG